MFVGSGDLVDLVAGSTSVPCPAQTRSLHTRTELTVGIACRLPRTDAADCVFDVAIPFTARDERVVFALNRWQLLWPPSYIANTATGRGALSMARAATIDGTARAFEAPVARTRVHANAVTIPTAPARTREERAGGASVAIAALAVPEALHPGAVLNRTVHGADALVKRTLVPAAREIYVFELAAVFSVKRIVTRARSVREALPISTALNVCGVNTVERAFGVRKVTHLLLVDELHEPKLFWRRVRLLILSLDQSK